MNKTDEVERVVAGDAKEAIWLRMRRLTIIILCRRLLADRQGELSPELLQLKSEQTAWSVRSLLSYWQDETTHLNARILARHYAMLQATIAEQVASSDAESTLEKVQRHTELGHGLFTINTEGARFPSSMFIGCMPSGHFPNYCKHLGVALSPFIYRAKRPRAWSEIAETESHKLVNLGDLLARIPELQSIIYETIGHDPRSMHILKNPLISRDCNQLLDCA